MSRGWVHCRIGSFDLEANWSIEPGEVLVLFGPSGAGKTSTLRAIAGLLRPQRGHIEIGGRVVYDSDSGLSLPAHRRRVGYLTQRYNLFPHLNVAKNIAYGLRGWTSAAAGERVRELIEVLRLDGLEQRRPWELSGGQQQRVALGRALAPNPEVLLLDEPFASLDMELRRIFRRELRSTLAKSKVPVLLVTHEREEALALADSIQVIDEGRPLAQGSPLDVLGQPGQERVANLVGVENLFALTIESRNPHDGTMVCVGGGLRIEVPLDASLPNTGAAGIPRQDSSPPSIGPAGVHGPLAGQTGHVTIGIRSSDIILSHQDILGSTARNRLRGVVTSVELMPPGYQVTLDCGQPLRCQITGAALDEMNIRPGMDLWAVFKASSCFLVQDASPQEIQGLTDIK